MTMHIEIPAVERIDERGNPFRLRIRSTSGGFTQTKSRVKEGKSH
jgi:hypothetical protein